MVDFDVDGLDAIFEAVRAHRRAVVERSPDDLDAIGDALDTYMTAVWRRAAELNAMVPDTITQEKIDRWWAE